MSHYQETGTYLDRILARTIDTVATAKRNIPPAEMARRAASAAPAIDLVQPTGHLGVIAEIKRASPSKGRFPVEINPAAVTDEYISGGASAISCLTDAPFFQGSLDDLRVVVQTSAGRAPVLRKDFIIDSYQIDEARASGASLVLLIAAVLNHTQLTEYRRQAESLGMKALVEVHNEGEAACAVESGATLIGINNRNLRTFETDLTTTERITPIIPSTAMVVGESGIHSVEDARRMAAVGCDFILVGESLILQPDRNRAVRMLTSVERP